MITTHTFKAQSKLPNSTNGSKMHSQHKAEEGACVACIVATATKKTANLIAMELAEGETRTAQLEQELAQHLKDLGLKRVEDLKNAPEAVQKSWVATEIEVLVMRLNKRRLSSKLARGVQVSVGDQVVVSWLRSLDNVQRILTSSRLTPYLQQGYTLEVRTDIETYTKPEQG